MIETAINVFKLSLTAETDHTVLVRLLNRELTSAIFPGISEEK